MTTFPYDLCVGVSTVSSFQWSRRSTFKILESGCQDTPLGCPGPKPEAKLSEEWLEFMAAISLDTLSSVLQ
jgi:hypothetical protein